MLHLDSRKVAVSCLKLDTEARATWKDRSDARTGIWYLMPRPGSPLSKAWKDMEHLLKWCRFRWHIIKLLENKGKNPSGNNCRYFGIVLSDLFLLFFFLFLNWNFDIIVSCLSFFFLFCIGTYFCIFKSCFLFNYITDYCSINCISVLWKF